MYYINITQVYERCPVTMDTKEAEKIQSEVLKVLMCVMHHSSQLQEEYLNIGGHALLCKVLTSSRSVPGPLTLKVVTVKHNVNPYPTEFPKWTCPPSILEIVDYKFLGKLR